MHKHTPVPLFRKPNETAPIELRLSYELKGFADWVVCSSCGMIGLIGRSRVKWLTPETVGGSPESTANKKQQADDWNAKVAAAEATQGAE